MALYNLQPTYMLKDLNSSATEVEFYGYCDSPKCVKTQQEDYKRGQYIKKGVLVLKTTKNRKPDHCPHCGDPIFWKKHSKRVNLTCNSNDELL